ncbi:MAG TPA: methyltransferase domain-containing protein [Candidatus Agrococcus pullicola]|uniref:Methyltransferase domain-containing protein n=1 Tax=Candidatus Agrococcus pullicola TaxID=2838429 RepID=A0A9D2C785_9MICO|nr:methyltransferase domain-containing protein [Candidatus Agrococcus pullicola]
MTLSKRAEHLTELMDDPECDPVKLRRTLERFKYVNRIVAGWASIYRSRIRPEFAAAQGPVRLLDIGCGAGDVLRRMVFMARRDGFSIEGIGIDPDTRALEVARAAKPVDGVSYQLATSTRLAAAGERFDAVISNHLLHHLDTGSLAQVIRDTEQLTTRIAVHSDIERGWTAYGLYAAGILPLAPGTFLRTDGLLSIRRSFTAEELESAVPRGWRIHRGGPFRLLAVLRRGGETS